MAYPVRVSIDPAKGPETFLVAVLESLGSPLRIVEVSSPSFLEAGQVFVRNIKSGACATQLHEIDGTKGPDEFLPHALGHEGVGEVVGVGPGVRKVQTGDLVVLHWRSGSGIQAKNAKYLSIDGEVNSGPVTTFSEFSVVSENRVTQLPQTVPLEHAPLFGCSLTTGFGSVVREARVTPGEAAVIIGFGGVGISILKTLKMVSASPIVVVDIDERKLWLAQQLGADETIIVGVDEGDLARKVLATSGRTPDVVFEVTGKRHLIEQAYAMTSTSGRTVLLGVPKVTDPASIGTYDLNFGKRLIGSNGGSTVPDRDIPLLARLIEAGRLSLADIPLEAYPLNQINSALDSLRFGTLGRILVETGMSK